MLCDSAYIEFSVVACCAAHRDSTQPTHNVRRLCNIEWQDMESVSQSLVDSIWTINQGVTQWVQSLQCKKNWFETSFGSLLLADDQFLGLLWKILLWWVCFPASPSWCAMFLGEVSEVIDGKRALRSEGCREWGGKGDQSGVSACNHSSPNFVHYFQLKFCLIIIAYFLENTSRRENDLSHSRTQRTYWSRGVPLGRYRNIDCKWDQRRECPTRFHCHF